MISVSSGRMNCCSLSSSFCWLLFCSLFFHSCHGITDTLRAGQVLGLKEFLMSTYGNFQLSFDTFVPSKDLYLTIGNTIGPVWIANRNSPFSNTSELALTITQNGYLVVTNGSADTSFIINPESSPQQINNYTNTSLKILGSGNLVLQDGNRILWQSFDYPVDTLLPGMKLGQFRTVSGHLQNGVLTSWLSKNAPRSGAFTFGVDPNYTKQLVILQRGDLYWRSGMWDGHNTFPFLVSPLPAVNFSYTSSESENESYFTFTVTPTKLYYYRITVGSSGGITYSRLSTLLETYESKSMDCVRTHSLGCTDEEPSMCKRSDKFDESIGAMSDWWADSNISYGLSDCKKICMRDCSCTAYVSAELDGTGCKFSKGQYQKTYPRENSEKFFLRFSTVEITDPPLPQPIPRKHSAERRLWFIIAGSVFGFIILIVLVTFCYKSSRNCCYWAGDDKPWLNEKKDHDLPFFSFSSVDKATNHFSDENKLGEGGFGPVYKGKLEDGQDIAVKRLSRRSGQGLQEFSNETILISKLQHRNLVKLLGCCVEGEEKILIYEYMPNNSLDSFLFDATKRALLDWKLRVSIIEGIAQGLLYLHKYSRLRIIHRDLKTSNVLLDENMNPKISDFGTARIFSESESPASTNRIVGTYGYMSPEYAMDGIFSEKSDVFSFGVMMLEISSGQKNSGFYQSDQPMNLLSHTWELWREGRGSELMDRALGESCSRNELVRFVQVVLLCVQENAADRPTMSHVVSMISNTTGVLPDPKQPAFSNVLVSGLCGPLLHECSLNHATISDVQPR